MSSDNDRIPISQLPVFSPVSGSYYLVGNTKTSETGIIDSAELITNYLSDTLDGSEDLPGLTAYISTHCDVGELPAQIDMLTSVHYSWDDLSDAELVAFKGIDSTVRMNIGEVIQSYLDVHFGAYLYSLPQETPEDEYCLIMYHPLGLSGSADIYHITLSNLANYLSNRST